MDKSTEDSPRLATRPSDDVLDTMMHLTRPAVARLHRDALATVRARQAKLEETKDRARALGAILLQHDTPWNRERLAEARREVIRHDEWLREAEVAEIMARARAFRRGLL